MTVLGLDTFQRANQSGWGSASDVGGAWSHQTGTATLAISNNQGTVTGATASQSMLLGSNTSADMEILTRVSASASGDNVYAIARFTGAGTFYFAGLNTATGIAIRRVVSSTFATVASASFTWTPGNAYWIRFQVQGTNLLLKMWADGTSEPTTWNITTTDTNISGAGQFGIRCGLAATTDTVTVDHFSVDDLTYSFGTDSLISSENATYTETLTDTPALSVSESASETLAYSAIDSLTSADGIAYEVWAPDTLSTSDGIAYEVWVPDSLTPDDSASAFTVIFAPTDQLSASETLAQAATQPLGDSGDTLAAQEIGTLIPSPVIVDTFQRANDPASWDSASDIGGAWVHEVGSATLAISNNQGTVTGTINPQLMVQDSINNVADADLLLRVSMSGTGDNVFLVARQQASNTYYFAGFTGTTSVGIRRNVNGTIATVAQTTFSWSINTAYWMRFRVQGINLLLKVWADGTAEPTNWNVSTNDSNISGTGGVGIRVVLGAATDVVSVDHLSANSLIFNVGTDQLVPPADTITGVGVPALFVDALTCSDSIAVTVLQQAVGPDDNPYGVTFGLNNSNPPTYCFDHWQQLFADMQTLGLTWLRFQMGWNLIQLNQNDPTSNFVWGPLDEAVQLCNQNGVKLVFPIRNAPNWALANPAMQTNNESPSNNGGLTSSGFYLPDPAMMATFAGQVAARYNGQNGHGFLDAIEMGNEDFNIHFSQNGVLGIHNSPFSIYNALSGATTNNQPSRDPWFFAQVASPVSSAISTNSPGTVVGMCALYWYYKENYTDFMQELYNDGVAGTFAYANAHFYSAQTDPLQESGAHGPSFYDLYKNVYSVMSAHGDRYKHLRITEYGWGINTTTCSTQVSPGTVVCTPQSMAIISNGDSLTVDSGVNQETVTVTAVTASTFTATFAKAHTGTWTIVDNTNGVCDPTTQATRYLEILQAARDSGVVSHMFFFTLNYKTDLSIPNTSLVQYQSKTGQYLYLPAFSTMQNFIATTPQFSGSGGETWHPAEVSTPTPVVTLVDSLSASDSLSAAILYAPADATACSDSIIFANTEAVAAFTDTLSTSDGLVATINPSLSDALTLSESLVPTPLLLLADALSAPGESMSLTLAAVPQDTLTSLETLAASLATSFAADSATALEILLATDAYNLPADQLTTANDSASSTSGYSPTDQLSCVDAALFVLLDTPGADTLSTQNDVWAAAITLATTNDALSESETLLSAQTNALADSPLSASEQLSLLLAEQSSDALSASETPGWSATWTALVESVPANDALALALTQAESDSVSASETLTLAALALAGIDSSSASETLATLVLFVVQEALSSPLDALSVSEIPLLPADALAISDALALLLVEQTLDQLSASDAIDPTQIPILPIDTLSTLIDSLAVALAFTPGEGNAPGTDVLVESIALALPADSAPVLDTAALFSALSLTENTAPPTSDLVFSACFWQASADVPGLESEQLALAFALALAESTAPPTSDLFALAFATTLLEPGAPHIIDLLALALTWLATPDVLSENDTLALTQSQGKAWISLIGRVRTGDAPGVVRTGAAVGRVREGTVIGELP